MNKYIRIIFFFIFIISILNSCGKKKESSMVDMDSINNDGSHNDKYIFQKEIEKDEARKNKYQKNKF